MSRSPARMLASCSTSCIEPDPEQPDQGLARLPEPSPLDVFFDIEADPWAIEDDRLRPRVPPRSGARSTPASPTTAPSGATIETASGPPSSAFIDLVWSALRRRPGDARLPLRRLRVGRRQAAHAASRTRARTRSTSSSATGVLVDLSERRPPGHPCLGRVVLDQADRAVLHVAARGAGHGGRASASSSTRRGDAMTRTRSGCSTSWPPTTATTASRPWKLRDWLEATASGSHRPRLVDAAAVRIGPRMRPRSRPG